MCLFAAPLPVQLNFTCAAQYKVLGITFHNNSQSIAFILYMKHIINTDSVVYVAYLNSTVLYVGSTG